MEQAIRVVVEAADPITRAGVASHLQASSGFTVAPRERGREVDVVVAAVDSLSAETVAALRAQAAKTNNPVVLVVNDIKDDELLAAVECGVVAILPRTAVADERLQHAVLAAARGGGAVPPDLLGQLFSHVERLQREVLEPRGLSSSGLSGREVDVLRLIAEGWDTAEIADKLCYSERTVKNVIYGVTNRLGLRNRSHAVAYALRAGMI